MTRLILLACWLHASMATGNATASVAGECNSGAEGSCPDPAVLLQGRVDVNRGAGAKEGKGVVVDGHTPVAGDEMLYSVYRKAEDEEINADEMLQEEGYEGRNVASYWPGDVTLKSAGNRIYTIHSAVFVALTVCLCCVAGQYGRKGGQENNQELFDLMEAHNLHHLGKEKLFDLMEIPSFWQDPFGRQDFSRDRLRKSMPRVALSVGIWLLGLYCNNVCQAWLQQHMATFYHSHWVPTSPKKDHVLLWDVGFNILPAFSNMAVMEFFSQAMPILVVLRFCVFPGPLSMRWTILSRMFLLWGLLWALRAITIITTVLPNPDATCKPKVTYPNNIFMEALANMPFDPKHHEVTCQDVLFSGHTVLLTLATLMWLHYVHWAPWPEWTNASPWQTFAFRTLLILNMLAGYYCIVASKFHYTADVLIACVLSIFIFQAYHLWLPSALVPTTKPNVLRGFFAWFDEDAVDVAVVKTMLQRSLIKDQAE